MTASLLPALEQIVAAWFATATPPREVMAQAPGLRSRSADERAQLARAAAKVIAGQRWLRFAAGMDAEVVGSVGEGAAGHAQLLATIWACTEGWLQPVQARQRLAPSPRVAAQVDFAALADAPRRCAAIADPVQRLGIAGSLPDWLAQEFVAVFGAEAESVVAGLNASPPRTVRANLLRVADRAALAARLADEGIATRAAAHSPWALHVQGTADLFATRAFASGAFEQQDEASQLAVLATAPPPRGRVFDLCAGSGGKTLALAAMLGNRGHVLATDVHERRLAALRARLGRAGADNVQVTPTPQPELAGRADRILIDAPCSGTGSWRRRPEARWLLNPAGLAELNKVQDQLLDRGAALLRPGARLVYATCSLLPVENEQRVANLLARSPHLEQVKLVEVLGRSAATAIADPTGTFLCLRPDRHGCDGFFAAILRCRRGGSTAAQGKT